MPMRRIAAVVGRSVATVSRLLACLGLSSLKALDAVVPPARYEREAPGELQAFQRARDGAGLQDFHFHDLQPEAISRLFERD